MTDFDDNMCTCRARLLGGRVHQVTAPTCPIHGDLEAKAAQDEAARTKLANLWEDAYKAGWRDRNRIALGIHNHPKTPNPYRKVSE